MKLPFVKISYKLGYRGLLHGYSTKSCTGLQTKTVNLIFVINFPF